MAGSVAEGEGRPGEATAPVVASEAAAGVVPGEMGGVEANMDWVAVRGWAEVAAARLSLAAPRSAQRAP